MNALRAHVLSGRIVVDEPTSPPEGTELYLEPVSPDEDEGEAFDAAIGEGLDDFEAERVVDEETVRAKLRSIG